MTKDDLTALLPKWFKNIKEYPEIMKAYAKGLNDGEINIKQLFDNLFLQTCDEPTIAYYEGLMKIYPNVSDTLEVRRKRVISRWSMTGSYNEDYIKTQLNQLLGEHNYNFEILWVNIGFGVDVFARIIMYTYIPDGYDLALETWLQTAPAHIRLVIYEQTVTDIKQKMYFGGKCFQTTIENIS